MKSSGMFLSLSPVWLTGDKTTAPKDTLQCNSPPCHPQPRPENTATPKAQTYPRGFPASASLAGSQKANNSSFPAPPWCNCSEIAESDLTYRWM